MKLARWLSDREIRRSAFARLLGTSPGYITDLCNGKKKPSLDMAQRIMGETNGEVRPEDFFDTETTVQLVRQWLAKQKGKNHD